MPDKSALGGAGVLWLVATSDAPLTIDEIQQETDANVSRQAVVSAVIKEWRRGRLLRRERITPNPGKEPYEYTIAPREGSD